MQTHPQLAILDEFKIAIDKIPSTIPETKTEAEKLHANLLANEQATEEQVHQALVLIGKKVYPHRRAIKELLEKHKDEEDKVLEAHQDEYKELVSKWREEQKKIEEKIDQIRALVEVDPKWSDEIKDKINLFEEGWSVVEKDPDLYQVKKNIEYWKGKLGMEN